MIMSWTIAATGSYALLINRVECTFCQEFERTYCHFNITLICVDYQCVFVSDRKFPESLAKMMTRIFSHKSRRKK